MRIVVDIDDTLADFFGALQSRLGPAVDDTIENLEVMFPGDELMHYLQSDDFHREMLPLDGAVRGVTWLLESGHHLSYVTARDPNLQQLTQEWLEQWGFPKAALHCVGREAKIEFLGAQQYDAMIDDQMRYLKVAHEHGKRCIAIEKPWNAIWAGIKMSNWKNVRRAMQGIMQSSANR